MRVLFAGTPAAAVPSLRALLESEHEVIAVLTRPDAPTGRGRTVRASPVRELADDAGIPVLTPASLRGQSVQDELRDLSPDAAAVVAYGAMIPPGALEIPTHGWINLHFSILPALRGAAPVQRAVLAGDRATGMTTFRIDEGLDTGEILGSQDAEIGRWETSGDVLDRLAEEGSRLLLETLGSLEAGTARPVPQQGPATHAAKLTTAEARVDWSAPSAAVRSHILGMSPEPGAWTLLDGDRMKILDLEDRTAPSDLALAPGQLHPTRKALFVGTGDAPLALGLVAAAGRKQMRAADWARGAAPAPGTAFDTSEETR